MQPERERLPANAVAPQGNAPITAWEDWNHREFRFSDGTSSFQKWNSHSGVHQQSCHDQSPRASPKLRGGLRFRPNRGFRVVRLRHHFPRLNYFLPYSPPVAAASNEVWRRLSVAPSVIFLPSRSVT
jgi:hypothetical protein